MMSKVLVVIANSYPEISSNLERVVLDTLKEVKMEYYKIYVPSTFEIPNAINIALESVDYAGVVALGCVIKGDIMQCDVAINESTRALQDIAIYYSVPMGCGIISANNKRQAATRVEKYGQAAIKGCLELIRIKESYSNCYDQDISLFN